MTKKITYLYHNKFVPVKDRILGFMRLNYDHVFSIKQIAKEVGAGKKEVGKIIQDLFRERKITFFHYKSSKILLFTLNENLEKPYYILDIRDTLFKIKYPNDSKEPV